MKLFREMQLNEHPGGFAFFEVDCLKRRLNFLVTGGEDVTSIETMVW